MNEKIFVDEFGNHYPESEARALGLIVDRIPHGASATVMNGLAVSTKERREHLHWLKQRGLFWNEQHSEPMA